MTHYDAETLEEITDETLAECYDSYLDDHGLYDGLNIDGVELVPSEVLKCTDPVGYQECLNTYINALYDSGELITQWDREERIKELCEDWSFMELASLVDHTTVEQDKIIYNELFKLYERGLLVIDNGEIELSDQHDMLDILSALVARLNELKNI